MTEIKKNLIEIDKIKDYYVKFCQIKKIYRLIITKKNTLKKRKYIIKERNYENLKRFIF